MVNYHRFAEILEEHKSVGSHDPDPVLEYEVYVDEDGYAHDDEGNVEFVGKEYGPQTYGLHDMPDGVKYPRGEYSRERLPKPSRPRIEVDQRKVEALQKAIAMRSNEFLSSILSQVKDGRVLSDAQKKAVRQNFYRLRMKDDADLFR